MLPKSRILSVLLVGLGIALAVGGFAAPAFIHSDARLPLDLEQTTWTIEDDQAQTRLMTDPNGRVLEVPMTKQLHMDIQQPANQDEATVEIGSSLLRESMQADSERLVSAETWSYVMDRVTGEATSEADVTHTISFPPSTVPVEGYWLKFPTDAEQTTYEVFDQTLRESRPAVFAEEMTIDGREVYRYRQEIEPTNVAELYDGIFNTATIDGEEADLYHTAERDIYVDQVTGIVVDIRESIHDYYETADGSVREDSLVFDGARNEQQRSAALAELDGVSGQATAQWIRVGFIVLGVIVLIIGLIGSFGGFDRRRVKTARRRRK